MERTNDSMSAASPSPDSARSAPGPRDPSRGSSPRSDEAGAGSKNSALLPVGGGGGSECVESSSSNGVPPPATTSSIFEDCYKIIVATASLRMDGIPDDLYNNNKALCDLILNFKTTKFQISVDATSQSQISVPVDVNITVRSLVFPNELNSSARAILYKLCNILSLQIEKYYEPVGKTLVKFSILTSKHDGLTNIIEEAVDLAWLSENGLLTTPVDENNPLFLGNRTISDIYKNNETLVLDPITQQKSSKPLHSHTSMKDGYFLYTLILENKFTRTLETGLAYGLSALYITLAHQTNERLHGLKGNHIALDPFQKSHWESGGILNISNAGLSSYFSLQEEFSFLALPNLLAKCFDTSGGVDGNENDSQKLDLIYLDGPHMFDDVLMEMFYAVKLLRIGGIVYFDDHHLPSIHRVCSFMYHNLVKEGILEAVLTPTFPATAAFRKKSGDGRLWSHYKPF